MASRRNGYKVKLPKKTGERTSLKMTECFVVGEIGVGKRRVPDGCFTEIRIKFKASGPRHACDIGLEKLREMAKEKMYEKGASNVALRSVYVKNGKFFIPLKERFANKSILMARSSKKVFGETVWIRNVISGGKYFPYTILHNVSISA